MGLVLGGGLLLGRGLGGGRLLGGRLLSRGKRPKVAVTPWRRLVSGGTPEEVSSWEDVSSSVEDSSKACEGRHYAFEARRVPACAHLMSKMPLERSRKTVPDMTSWPRDGPRPPPWRSPPPRRRPRPRRRPPPWREPPPLSGCRLGADLVLGGGRLLGGRLLSRGKRPKVAVAPWRRLVSGGTP